MCLLGATKRRPRHALPPSGPGPVAAPLRFKMALYARLNVSQPLVLMADCVGASGNAYLLNRQEKSVAEASFWQEPHSI